MGNASASAGYISGPLEKLAEYDQAQARELLEKYWELDMEFGINSDGLKLLLSSAKLCADADFADSIMNAFPYQTLNVLDFIVGQGLMCRGSWEEKLSLAFDCIDFNRCEQVSFDELTILLLCAARGLLCLSGQLPELHPKTIKSAEMEKHDRNVSKMLAADFGLGGGGENADITKEQFTAWFRKKCAAPEEMDARTLIELCCAITKDFTPELAKLSEVQATNSKNRCAKYFDESYFKALDPAMQLRLMACVRSGFENPDSVLGCYAMTPEDYDALHPFFDKVIRDYHGAPPDAVHATDWDFTGVGEGGIMDVSKLGAEGELSIRVRVARNLANFNLTGSMDKTERIRFEREMLQAFEKLIAKFGGTVHSLSPDHGEGTSNPNLISPEKYDELLQTHVMFQDMSADPQLKSAGIASDWPYGRGCWQSEDKACIIWFGEEDQLRAMCMMKSLLINEVFDRLKLMLDAIESVEGLSFARSEKYGFITSCPSNLGTGMRASVHLKLPRLTTGGTEEKVRELVGPMGLSVHRIGDENGAVDISPRGRLFVKESEIVASLYKGIELLLAEERKLCETEKKAAAALAEEEKQQPDEQPHIAGGETADTENSGVTPVDAEGAPNEETTDMPVAEAPATVDDVPASTRDGLPAAESDGAAANGEPCETASAAAPQVDAGKDRVSEADPPVTESAGTSGAPSADSPGEINTSEAGRPSEDSVQAAPGETVTGESDTVAAEAFVKLNFIVHAAFDLKDADWIGKSDPRVYVCVFEEGSEAPKLSEKNESNADRWGNTRTIDDNLNPVFEETVVLNIASLSKPTVKLVVMVSAPVLCYHGPFHVQLSITALACPTPMHLTMSPRARFFHLDAPSLCAHLTQDKDDFNLFDVSADRCRVRCVSFDFTLTRDRNAPVAQDDNLEDLGHLEISCAGAEMAKTKLVLTGGNESSSVEVSFSKA